jgi:hypothetical protein
MYRALLALVFVAAAIPASAQIGVYGTFSAANFRLPNTGWQYGSTFGLYDNHWHYGLIDFGLDGRGSVIGGSASIASGLVGPRVVLKPHVLPFMPYLEVLGGMGHAEYGEGSAAGSTTKFEYNFVGGIDYTVLPRIDWRVVDFSYGGLAAFKGSFNPRTVSTGIVFRLP